METLQKVEYKNDIGKMTYYKNEIDFNKETIVMIHPAFADHQIFIRQVEFFTTRYNLILMDLPGHGLSNIKESKLDLWMTPNLLQEILLQEKIKKVHLLGVSVGSLLVQGFADLYEDMVKTVTIVGGYSIHKDNSEVQKSQGKEMLRWLFYIVFSMKKFRNHIVRSSVISPLGIQTMTKGTDKITRGTLLRFKDLNKLFRKLDRDKNYPLLAVVGEHDLPIAHKSAKILVSTPNSRLCIIKDAGHCANIDNDAAFNDNYNAFINEYE